MYVRGWRNWRFDGDDDVKVVVVAAGGGGGARPRIRVSFVTLGNPNAHLSYSQHRARRRNPWGMVERTLRKGSMRNNTSKRDVANDEVEGDDDVGLDDGECMDH